jgi:selenocysteine lyase/cysteine desulfurase
LAPKNEHNSNLIPYLNQANRGVTIEYVPLSELASKTVKGITLVTCSAASFLTGEVADIDAIREATRAVGALFCLDATQACGWLPLDGNSADIVACSVHKFLCSPIGGAFLVMRPELAARIKPVTPSWVACKDSLAPPNGTDFDLAEGARKFDTVPNLVSMVGAQRSIDLITQIGVHKIYQHNLELANRFRDGIGLPPSNSAIVTIFRPGAVEQLARANIRAMEWCGNLRVSFHYYNSEEDVNHALDVLAGPRP